MISNIESEKTRLEALEDIVERMDEAHSWNIGHDAVFAVLSIGVDLEIFTHIANGHCTASDIAKVSCASPRGIEILLNCLVSLKFLTKSNGKYGLTSFTEIALVKNSLNYYGNFPHIDHPLWPWKNLIHVIKTGKSFPHVEQCGEEFYEYVAPQLFPMSYPVAKAAAEKLKVGSKWKNLNVLDVASGSGVWGIAFAECDTNTRVTAQDWPAVLKVTEEFVNKFNLSQQFNYLPGDLREVNFGQAVYDLVILGHILHSEGEKQSKVLFSRVYQALKPGGMLLISEIIPDEERATDIYALFFTLQMLQHTSEGSTFTLSEIQKMAHDTGFRKIKTIKIPGNPYPLICASKGRSWFW